MKTTLTLISFFISIQTFGLEVTTYTYPKVDFRVELMSITFRLAGAEEYSQNTFPKYTSAIDSFFKPYKEHELILYIQRELLPKEIGYDAVMCMALNLTQPPEMKPVDEFSDLVPDPRWSKETSMRFLTLLNTFFVDSNCSKFFKQQQKIHESCLNQFMTIYNEVDFSWYEAFFGEPQKGKYQIVLGLANGLANYSVTKSNNGISDNYAIIGAWNVRNELPEYKKKDFLPMIIHEFNHPFINYRVINGENQFKNNVKEAYQDLKEKMRLQAYDTWQVMIQESIVRACVIQYMIEHNYPKSEIDSEITLQLSKGFIWVPDLIDQFNDHYQTNRIKYPTFSSFFPELIKFFNTNNTVNLTRDK